MVWKSYTPSPLPLVWRGTHLRVVLDLGFGAAGPQGQDTAVVKGEGDHLAGAGDWQHRTVVRLGGVVAGGQVPHGNHFKATIANTLWILQGGKEGRRRLTIKECKEGVRETGLYVYTIMLMLHTVLQGMG